MFQNVIKTTMYNIVENYASNIASFRWDVRNDKEYEDSTYNIFNELRKLVCKETAKCTLRTLLTEGSAAMMLSSSDLNQLEKWEQENVQWYLVVYEGPKIDENVTPFAILTRDEVTW